jgi:hypothetical protein
MAFLHEIFKYIITGVPFYNNENENEFKKSFEDVLNFNSKI